MASISPISGLLGTQNAAHLLRRATYKATPSRINQYANYTIAQAMNELFAPISFNVPAPLHHLNNLPFIPTSTLPNPTPVNIDYSEYINMINWWLRESQLSNTAHFKLSYWICSIYIVNLEFIGHNNFLYDYIQLSLYYSNKSLKDLAKKMTRLNGMLFYLGNYTNTAISPNENYAREFLELFTILKGPPDGPGSYTTYTEQDVQAAARILTGFTVIPEAQRLNYIDPICQIPLGTKNLANHDTGNKSFSSKFGNQIITGSNTLSGMDTELDSFIDMVFAQTATAKSYARRLYRFYVKGEINAEIEADIITPLANTLLNNNYNLQIAVTQLLSSEHFFDEDDTIAKDEAIGAMIKTPMDLTLGMMNDLEISTVNPNLNANHIYRYLYQIIYYYINLTGQSIFNALNVQGFVAHVYEPYDKLWITTNTLPNRRNSLIEGLINGMDYANAITQFNVVSFVRYSGHFSNPGDAYLLVDQLLAILFVQVPTGSRLQYFRQALLNSLSTQNWQFEWNNYISSNNEASVKVALNRLFRAAIKSREYQVH